ncbi:helix-turn-helix domain-containing protein [Paenibacillus arenilitoris]|uniref:Helix-turn-helix domain-containing protein n=1 Tax=Paenibacillus arenilitoris TaxID=2772299 RepID=A0A927CL47_9BACL|nr:helix-turn-helix domain-containing protein [Paenibacillus arenilitoris]MBD2870044.1 helix-turn-helix domain-containing protein [Paenibacillus arenilitoris]
MEKEVTAGNMSMLEQSKEILDSRMEEINVIVQQLASDTRIARLLSVRDPFAGTNTFQILDTHKNLYNYALSNSFMTDYFVFFRNSELVLTPGGTYRFQEFYDHVLSYDRYGYDEWRRMMLGKFHNRDYLPAEDVQVRGMSRKAITYVQSLGYPGNPQGEVVVLIDGKEIEKLFKGLDSSEGEAFIVDEQGRIVSSLSPHSSFLPIDASKLEGARGVVEQAAGSTDMTITYIKSSNNGWTYLVTQPTRIFLKKVLYIQKITFTATFIFLLLGTLAAYILAYKNSKPIRNILNLILERSGAGHNRRDAYRFIGETVTGLIDNNLKLKAEIDKQIPLLRAASLQRLLNGGFLSVEEAKAMLEHVGIKLDDRSFVVSLLYVKPSVSDYNDHSLDELDIWRVLTKQIVEDAALDEALCFNTNEDHFAILFICRSSENNFRERVEKKTETIAALFRDRLNRSPINGLGGLAESLTGISRSFEQAKQALNYLVWQNREGFIWFDQLPGDNGSYYYPLDMEIRLMNLAKAGDEAEAMRLLEEMRKENFENRKLSYAIAQLFLYEMWGSVLKLLPQLELSHDGVLRSMNRIGEDVVSFEELESNYGSITLAYRWICGTVNEYKKSQNGKLLEKIVALLNESYMHDDLCLEAAADRLRISKVYLSQFFKEQTGVNFSDYLENLRMERAKSLLLQTNLAVGEIAYRVGYSSSNTFCRAFKRINGVSATAFKQSQGLQFINS